MCNSAVKAFSIPLIQVEISKGGRNGGGGGGRDRDRDRDRRRDRSGDRRRSRSRDRSRDRKRWVEMQDLSLCLLSYTTHLMCAAPALSPEADAIGPPRGAGETGTEAEIKDRCLWDRVVSLHYYCSLSLIQYICKNVIFPISLIDWIILKFKFQPFAKSLV